MNADIVVSGDEWISEVRVGLHTAALVFAPNAADVMPDWWTDDTPALLAQLVAAHLRNIATGEPH